MGNVSPKPGGDESKASIYETAQTLKRLSSSSRKTPPQRTESIDQQSPPTPSLRKTTQELLRKKSSLEQAAPTAQPYDRTPSMHSRPLTRSNSINPVNKDHEKFSSGDRSYQPSGAPSRRVSIGLNRSPIRAEDLESVLTKVNYLIVVFLCLLVHFSLTELLYF